MQWKFLKPKKDKFFLTLDVGTEAVKTLISFKEQDKKLTILGAGLAYFDKYDVFDTGRFETEIIKKAILNSMDNASSNLSFCSVKKELKQRAQKQKNWPVLMTLPPDILKSKIVSQNFLRTKPREKISQREEKIIRENIFKKAKEKIAFGFTQEFGILPSELYWASLKILEIKIDGYQVLTCQGYQGKNLEFKILATFLPRYYLESIRRIVAPLKFSTLKMVHLAEAFSFIQSEKHNQAAEGSLLAFKKTSLNSIFFDVGGDITQILVVRNGQLEGTDEFNKGGKMFVQALSQRLGLEEASAREMIRRYSDKNLSREALARIKEIFSWEKKIWYDNLKSRLEKISFKLFDIFLLGGGSLVPDIQQVLEENFLKSEFVSLEDIDNVNDATRILDNPQYIPSLLICYV